MMRDHDFYRELTAGHALSALEPEDDLELAAHLQGCAECRRELVEMTQTAAELAYVAPAEEPPAAILDNLRAAMRADLAGVPDSAEHPAAVPGEALVVGLSDRPGRPRTDSPARDGSARDGSARGGSARGRSARGRSARALGRQRLSVPIWGLAAAASAVVLAAASLLGLRMHDNSVSRNRELASYAQVVQSITQPGATVLSLTGMGGPAHGTAVVVGDTVHLISADLGINNARDSIYVLWAQGRSGHMIALGKFDVTGHGPVLVTARMPADPSDPAFLAVSEESGLSIPAIPHDEVLASADV